jgi:type VI protein secretion system component VasF
MTITAASVRKGGLTLVPALTQIEVGLPYDPFLLTRFEEFYEELVRFKTQLGSHIRLSATSAQDIQQALAALLVRQESEVERTGTLLGLEMYRQAQRVMTCLADEVFGSYSWQQGKWPSLEVKLFGVDEPAGLSREGQCFRKLDQLLRQDDPVYRELAWVYFYALVLGKTGDREADDYIAALGKMIMPAVDGPRLFPQSYAHTLAENKLTFLPSSRKWWLGLAGIIVAWLVVSWGLWSQVSGPVKTQLHEIRKMLRP